MDDKKRTRKGRHKFDGDKEYRNNAIRCAKDLHYGETIINKIKNAKNDSEICRIMTDSRRNKI